jgi:hypothetical protein
MFSRYVLWSGLGNGKAGQVTKNNGREGPSDWLLSGISDDNLACFANTGHSLNDGGKFELFDYYDISQY